MYARNKILPFILLVVIVVCGCEKDDPHIPIDPFLLHNFNYQPGTYWIYTDSLTGETDSFLVIKNNFSSPQISGNTAGRLDEILIVILQYNPSKLNVAKWEIDLVGNGMGIYSIGFYTGSDTLSYPLSYPLITVPFKTGTIDTNYIYDSGYVISTDGNYTINSQHYTGVVQFRHVCDSSYYYHDNTFYMNTDVGIIKMDLKQRTHKVWELVQSRIKK